MSSEEEVLGKAYDSRLMRRLLTYLRPYKVQTTIALAAIVLKALAEAVGPFLVKTEIDKYLVKPHQSAGFLDRFLSPDAYTGIEQIAGIYAGIIALSFILEFAQTYFMQWTGQKVMFDLRSQIFRHLQHMHVGFYDKNPVGRLVTRVTTDVDALNELFTSGVVSIFEDIFVLAGIITIMTMMNWKLALITFAVLPLIAYATQVFRIKVRDSYRRIRTAIARINSHLQEHVSGMTVLQLFNRERRAYDKFSDVNDVHREAYKDAILAHAVYYPVVEILSSVAIATVIWFGGNQVLRKVTTLTVSVGLAKGLPHFHLLPTLTTLGVLVAFMQYAQRFFKPIQDLSEKYNILQSAMASAERVFKLLDTPTEITPPAVIKTPTGPGQIDFDHVWFAYRHIDDKVPDWVLRDVSFTVTPGETVAFVGHTGAGKTTIISLLLRFYDVQKGAVRIDGVDIKDIDLADLRRRFGVVLQDPFLFSGTVAQNIRLGSGWITDGGVEKAAEEVNVADFIRSLPQGFQEEVRERGSTLSTGQKQLISFARALAHEPKILILDEATSSVDTETEFRVRDALTRMVAGRTSLIIAHRLSTIQRADKIILLHKGQLREMGSHQQLLAKRGIYFKLYQLQYKDQELPSPATAITAD
jgi:ATP-binding cassette subfamily B protein